MPEVAIYEGEPNAFATGAFKNSALVAVSTGLLQSMNKEEVEAVLGHEIAHVANGDMVTLTLIQGVVNTFVVFLARIIGSIVDKRRVPAERGNGPGYFITVIVAADRARHPRVDDRRVVLAPARVPRRRGLGASTSASPSPMVNALRRLGGLEPGELPKAMSGFGITDKAASWRSSRRTRRSKSASRRCRAAADDHVQDRVRGRQGHLERRLRG